MHAIAYRLNTVKGCTLSSSASSVHWQWCSTQNENAGANKHAPQTSNISTRNLQTFWSLYRVPNKKCLHPEAMILASLQGTAVPIIQSTFQKAPRHLIGSNTFFRLTMQHCQNPKSVRGKGQQKARAFLGRALGVPFVTCKVFHPSLPRPGRAAHYVWNEILISQCRIKGRLFENLEFTSK